MGERNDISRRAFVKAIGAGGVLAPLVGSALVRRAAATAAATGPTADLGPLAVGVAGHAFDHLGGFADQAAAAAASGANILYVTGVGGLGYAGLLPEADLRDAGRKTAAYLGAARKDGMRLAIGYVCSTSIVKLADFDKHWPADLRAKLSSPPDRWLQQGRDGKPLPSWYGGDYRPACMSNPDWRAYEKFVVGRQIDAGCDGIFFDNPTVHPDGCYCPHCMRGFAAFLKARDPRADVPAGNDVPALRRLAVGRPADFMRFRCTVARDFLADIRAFARTLNPAALVTCNNSLNAPSAFFAQCRTHAYNIHELSAAQDLVVVEDMQTQARVLPDGSTVEYGPVYAMLRAIARGKPVVAVALADGDYHTPPNLVRLAMAEAAAREASYLSWPTWPEAQRARMAAAVRPQADLLRANASLLNGHRPRADVTLLLPFDRWGESADCPTLGLAQALSAANVQFVVAAEEGLADALAGGAETVLLVESRSVLTPALAEAVKAFEARGGRVVSAEAETWLADVRRLVRRPGVVLEQGPPTLRAVVTDGPAGTVVHLLNLNVRKLSSFEDKVTPAENLTIRVRVPHSAAATAEVLTADAGGTRGAVPLTFARDAHGGTATIVLPRVDVSAMIVIRTATSAVK